ncbi:polysaccharide deacetylase family protein [Desulfuribacillus alkaliarsenatis]|uniref:NodB homology domain-containing protein n=1 Tax=Desulfuribacillus alkaliarsenatis TaxID=766136 RepID=A0A1E5G1L2_9FIRM|nr:polysaccharide deacetylase family protein [Desulfuribacillus alkaliarsenatis]OEF96712.1 hypothetical protein BHF68_06460 [Desulfuribacillus alkaliarsenatis]
MGKRTTIALIIALLIIVTGYGIAVGESRNVKEDGTHVYRNVNNVVFIEANEIAELLDMQADYSGAFLAFRGQTSAEDIIYIDKQTFTYKGYKHMLLVPYKRIDSKIYIDETFLYILGLGLNKYTYNVIITNASIANNEETQAHVFLIKSINLPTTNIKHNSIPILMYHKIAEPSAGNPMRQLYVSTENFNEQMRTLKENGYNTVTMEEVYRHWEYGDPLPEKPIVLSFDDGYLTDLINANPILIRHEYRGNFYVNPGGVLNNSPGLMSIEQIQMLAGYGHLIGSHGYYHSDLSMLSAHLTDIELSWSKATLESWLGRMVEHFCYPYGRYQSYTLKALEDIGYKTALTTQYGFANSNQDYYQLARIRINYSDDLRTFKRKVGIR